MSNRQLYQQDQVSKKKQKKQNKFFNFLKNTAPIGNTVANVRNWNKEQIQKWMEKENISDLEHFLKDFDGKMLQQLQNIRLEVPDFFYRKIDQVGLDFKQILRLTSAMDNFE